MVYFGEFCRRYMGKTYPDRHLPGPVVEYAPGEEDVTLFAAVFLFEEIGNYYNVEMARDPRLNPIVSQINAFHRREEARHIVFGRELVKALFDRWAPAWSAETLSRVREYLASFVAATWRGGLNPRMYRDIGAQRA